ncbi:UNVERIFIED_CONTAM: Protein YIF1A [Sesamum indicum]
MYETSDPQARFFVPVSCNQSDQLGSVLNYVAGSDLIRGELGAYGEKILGSGSEYVQSSISRYISNPRYYFQVNDDYVKNKLKVVLFPFLHKGHWMRTVEPAGGKFSFKPPIHDINAPDLYIPMMAFGTYVLLAGFFLGINGKFSPESLGVQFSTGLLCWLLQVLLLEATLHSLGGGEVPLLDMVAYAGYTFVGAAVIVAVRLLADFLFCVATLWESLCMGVLLVKTMKRILISEVQSFEKNSTKRNYILLFTAAAQIPLLFWLGSVSVETR